MLLDWLLTIISASGTVSYAKIVFRTYREDISLFFFWIDGKILLIFLLMQFHLLDSSVLFICLL